MQWFRELHGDWLAESLDMPRGIPRQEVGSRGPGRLGLKNTRKIAWWSFD